MTIILPDHLPLPEGSQLIANLKPYYAPHGGVMVPCYVLMDLPSPVTTARLAQLRRQAGAAGDADLDTQLVTEMPELLSDDQLHAELERRGIYLRPREDETSATVQLLNEPGAVGVIVTTRDTPGGDTEDWWIIREDEAHEDPDLKTSVSARPAAKRSLTIQDKTVFLHELTLSDLRVLTTRISERFSEQCGPEEERELTPEHWPLSDQAEGHLWVTVISMPEDESMSANDAADQTVIGATPGIALNDLQHEDHPTIPGAYLTFAQLNTY